MLLSDQLNDTLLRDGSRPALPHVGEKRTIGAVYADGDGPAPESASKRSALTGEGLDQAEMNAYLSRLLDFTAGDGDEVAPGEDDHMALETGSEFEQILETPLPRDVTGNVSPATPHVDTFIHTTDEMSLPRNGAAGAPQAAVRAEPMPDANPKLLKAARRGNLANVRDLVLNHGADVNYEAQSCSVLHFAAFYNHIDVVRFLVENGADINRQNLSGLTPLHWALEKGDLNLMKHLINHGADVNVGDKDNLTVLHKAVQTGNHAAVEHLVKVPRCNVDAAASEENHRLTALHVAATLGDARSTQMLLGAGANVCSMSTRGGTPLHKAAVRGHVNVIRLLVRNGAPIDLKDQMGRSPLHWAVFFHRLHAVRALKELGANADLSDRFGNTCWVLAQRRNYNDVISALAGR